MLGLALMLILLPQPLRFWDYSCELLLLQPRSHDVSQVGLQSPFIVQACHGSSVEVRGHTSALGDHVFLGIKLRSSGTFTCCPLAGPGTDIFEGNGPSCSVAMCLGLVCLMMSS